MTASPTVRTGPSSTAPPSDPLEAAARLAAVSAGAPVGLVWLRAGAVTVWAGAPGVAVHELPVPDSFATRHLVPALAAAHGSKRALRRLADDPDLRGVVGDSVDGLASAVTSHIRNAAGASIGLVAAFDRVARTWADESDELASIATLLSLSPRGLGHLAASRVIVETAQSIEDALGGEPIRALIDVAAQDAEATVRRHASQAQTVVDKVSLLRGRLRSALRSTDIAPGSAGAFDLLSTVQRAVTDACRGHQATVPVSSPEITVPVSGDARKAHLAVTRAIAVALSAAHPADLSVGVSSRSTDSHSLEGTTVGELSVRVQGVALGAPELLPIVAALDAPSRESAVAPPVRLRVAADEIHLEAPGFDATSSGSGTWMTLRWPIDLG